MSVLQVNTSTQLELYEQQTPLDGEIYTLVFRFNRRNESWYLDIADEDGNLVVAGRRCIVDSRMTGQFKHLEDLPPGELTVFDTTGRRAPPVLEDFGSRALLLYFDRTEAFA